MWTPRVCVCRTSTEFVLCTGLAEIRDKAIATVLIASTYVEDLARLVSSAGGGDNPEQGIQASKDVYLVIRNNRLSPKWTVLYNFASQYHNQPSDVLKGQNKVELGLVFVKPRWFGVGHGSAHSSVVDDHDMFETRYGTG